MTSFSTLGLRAELLHALEEMGFTSPTPVQEQAIPRLLGSDHDLVVLAQTGTGKTAAFGLPLLEEIDPKDRSVQALVLAPTRELCVQITGDLERFSAQLPGVNPVAIYGGASIREQIRAIQRGANIIVATPGRLLDLLGRDNILDLSRVQVVVLDEADEMLNMGFQEDLTSILSATPDNKRTWLFSATMGREVRQIAKRYMHGTEELQVGERNAAAAEIKHQYTVVHSRDRYGALKRFVDADPDLFAIVFCRTKHETQQLATQLVKDGYVADAIHGDLSQAQRDHVMGRYRARTLQLLIATDVAARGIDVNDVTHVIHFDLPNEAESYTHRSGRTARAGRSGISLSIIGVRERRKVQQLERMLKTHFTYVRVPGGPEIGQAQLMAYLGKLKRVQVDHEALEALLPIAHDQLAEFSKEQLIERFMSVAFDRLLGQFGALPDLNIDLSAKDHTLRNDRPSSRERFTTGRQLFINLGREHGFDKGKMLGYICGISGLSGDMIGRMYIDQYHAFIDIEPDHFQQVFNSLKGANYQGRKVRVDEGRGQQDRGDRPRQDRGDRPQHRKGPRSFDKGPKKPHRKGPKSGGRRFD
ncbi:MAG: DEAD/DEAH box helicase [Flavobacteriales bacterium]|nr:DEAD/DEAH box helicase [Flavobacteriales bacterium]MCB9199674.1 DEAD/DEAH box helicase [Flavobacteriales bacterium]HOP44187.1 DEAD/DEAH box helicase [Flavobacteriales bacterium]HPJ52797.1 DEAD/DEAH box helicase [Flavobacteriales bacterium]